MSCSRQTTIFFYSLREVCVGKARNQNDYSDDKVKAIKKTEEECFNDCCELAFNANEAANHNVMPTRLCSFYSGKVIGRLQLKLHSMR
jgi:hypothetical protein